MVLTGRIMYVDEVINMHCGMFINSFHLRTYASIKKPLALEFTCNDHIDSILLIIMY